MRCLINFLVVYPQHAISALTRQNYKQICSFIIIKFTVILIGGLYYALFSLFDQGVDYSSTGVALTSFTYIIMTQTLVGMGKATFTVVTGNPFIHFITLHIISARIPPDTRMFIEIFKIK